MSEKHVLKEVLDGVLYLKLNRPERLNAFSPEMISTLKESIKQAKENDSIRVIVISGTGRSFCSGGDVKTMGSREPLLTYKHIGRLNELILTMQSIEKPIIAAVHGYAAGAGFNLALACDLIVAADNSKFVLSFSKVGLVSDGGGHYFLSRVIGPYRAKELLFNAEPIDVEEANRLGIVNQVFPIEHFEEKVVEYANKIAQGPTVAYGFIKKLVDQSLNSTLKEILEQEQITQATVVTTEDHKEGVLAFKEKREPNFGKHKVY